MKISSFLIIFSIISVFKPCSGFVTHRTGCVIKNHGLFSNNRESDGERVNRDKMASNLPQLPPVGESILPLAANNNTYFSSSFLSSFSSSDMKEKTASFEASQDAFAQTESSESNNSLDGEKKTPVAFVGSRKFSLSYTCKCCGTRNNHLVSRKAYNEGVVITVCKGCKAKHWIADNLNWSRYSEDGFDGQRNIEEYMESQGKGDDINRVSKDVWELEEMLHKTGSNDLQKENQDRGFE